MKWKYPWKTAEFDLNVQGRDFVAGDLHGEFTNLEQALIKLDFDLECDRLFCVGDLVDRGPQSERVHEFLQHRWFYSIAGNHEWMLYNCHDDNYLRQSLWYPNGGGWWDQTDLDIKSNILRSVETKMHALITVESVYGRIGLVHALPHPHYSWSEFCQQVPRDGALQEWSLWERDFDVIKHQPIEGVDLILSGHTPVDRPLEAGNLINIDTGSGHTASYWLAQPALTVVQLSEDLDFHRF